MKFSLFFFFIIILVIGCFTFLLRAVPFLLFNKKNRATPKVIQYLGVALPPAVIGILIVYCLRNVSVSDFPFGLPELIAVVVVILLHLWKKNNLVSILGGTALYMVLIQMVFA